MTGPAYVVPRSTLDMLAERRRARHLVRRLVDGDWKSVLLGPGGSSAYRFRPLMTHRGRAEDLLVKINIVRAAVNMHAAIAVEQEPEVTVDGSAGGGFAEQLAEIGAIQDRILWESFLRRAVRAANTDGERPVRADVVPGVGVVLVQHSADEMLAVGPRGPDGQPEVWERRWVIERRREGRATGRYLRIERHRAPGGVGVVEQEAYRCMTDETLVDASELERVPLAEAIGPGLPVPPDTVETGLGVPLVVRLVCDEDDRGPLMLLDRADIDLVDTSAAMLSSLSRVLQLHGSPKLRGPAPMAAPTLGGGGDPSWAASGSVAAGAGGGGGAVGLGDYVIDPDRQIDYLQADGQFDSMLGVLNTVLHQLATVVLQVSPALLGTRFGAGATPDTVEKLVLESTGTLARARQTAGHIGPSLGRIITAACGLAATQPMAGWPVGRVRVRLRPSLPKDLQTRARELAEQRRDGLIDQRTALERLHGNDNAEAILARIRAEEEDRARLQQLALGVEIQPPGPREDLGSAGAAAGLMDVSMSPQSPASVAGLEGGAAA